MTLAINIADMVGSDLCLSTQDGHPVHNAIWDALSQQQDVRLSFEGVRRTTTAFLNVVVGQLYGEFSEGIIRKHLSVEGADPAQLKQLKRVVEGAKAYFAKDPGYLSASQQLHDGV